MESLRTFAVRVRDELWRSLGDTFGLFRGDGAGLGAGLADLVVKALVALLLATLAYLGYRLLRRTLDSLLQRSRFSRELRRPLLLALRYAVAVFALLAVLSPFGVSREVLGHTAAAALFAFLFYLVWLVSNRLLANAMHRYGLDRSLEQLLRNVFAVIVASIAFVTVMDQFGVDVLGVITALGIVGIAVGFAAQDTLSNFIAGVTLLIERPFRIGDWVEIGGQLGRVERISLRTTRLVTRANVLTSLPNASVASSHIVNLSGGGPLRASVAVGIAYKESARAAREAMLPVVEAHPKVLREAGREPRVLLSELADSSVNLTLQYWLAPDDIGAEPGISAEILEGCKEALDAAGIEIPFPHLQLFVDDAKGLTPALAPFFARPPREERGER